MKDRLDDKAFRQFAEVMGRMYEAVYEVDFYAGQLYVWKESEGGFLQQDSRCGYQEYVAEACRRRVHPEHSDAFRDWMSQERVDLELSGERKSREMELLVCGEGNGYRWFSIQMQVMERSGESFVVLLLARDVHEKHEEEQNRQRVFLDALQLMQAVNSAYDMLISVNLTQNSYYIVGYDRFLNHTAAEKGIFDDLIEAGASTVPGNHRRRFLQSFSRDNLLRAYREGKSSVYLEHQQYSDDGSLHWISTHVMFTENPYNDDILEITLSRCIDKLKEEEEKNKKALQDALWLAERANNAKTDFLSRMSHDIRTPMNAIIGMNVIAQENAENPEKVRDCLAKIDASSRYLLSLINDILDLSRIESGRMSVVAELFDFQKMMQGIAMMVSSQAVEKKQKFTIEISEDTERFYIGDELRLRQIFLNLLNNAHKYTPEGGEFSLSAQAVEATESRTQLRFRVRDNGIGIQPELVGKIFDPFVQGSRMETRSGSGLGLAITQNLVHLMGGSVSVESKYGEGSCFTVELSLSRVEEQRREKLRMSGSCYPQPEEAQQENPKESLQERPEDEAAQSGENHGEGFASVSFQKEKILLVEDLELNQEIVVTLLEMKNLTVDVASNGREAVEKFEASAPGEYALILMDIHMPLMDGYDATRKIRTLGRRDATKVPIYAMTADAFSSDVAKAVASGMNGHLAKPIDVEKLTAVLCKELK